MTDDLVTAVNGLAALIEAENLPESQRRRDYALRNEPSRMVRVLRARWRKQRAAVLRSGGLKQATAKIDSAILRESQESHDEEQERRKRIALLALWWLQSYGVILDTSSSSIEEINRQIHPHLVSIATKAVQEPVASLTVTTSDARKFDAGIANSIKAGAAEAIEQLTNRALTVPGNPVSGLPIVPTVPVAAIPDAALESFESEYLKSNGFQRLTGDFDQTSVDRLANAVANAWESGEGYAGAVKAVKKAFAEFSSFRADMIAQTELNDAFSQGVLEFGRQAGASQKSWVTDLRPCPICVANAVQGKIPIADDFISGADAPPQHPNCKCSILVHA